MKYHLKQQIAELVLELAHVAALDGVGNLIGLFDGVGRDAGKGLLAIPGTAVGRAQACHDCKQLAQAVAHGDSAACSWSSRRKVISMPAVAPQIFRPPYGMSYTSMVSSPNFRRRDLWFAASRMKSSGTSNTSCTSDCAIRSS